MIDFDEEIKNFKPSLEISRVEDAIVRSDITDMQDIMLEMFKASQNAQRSGND